MNPVKPKAAPLYGLDAALTAGRAQLQAMQTLASRLELTEEQRQKLLEAGRFMVPTLVESN